MAFNIDPHLEDKSLLVFEFKKKKGDTFRRVLNFIENITVKESVETNYSEYTPIGSNGSIFAYLGAKSRKLDLNFNITLPNIQEHTLIKPTAHNTTDQEGIKSSYFATENFGDFYKKDSYANLIGKFDTAFSENLTDNEKRLFREVHPSLAKEAFPDAIVPPFQIPLSNATIPTKGIPLKKDADYAVESSRIKSIYQVMYWVNLIRSCVLTHSKRPYLGPPIITLTHGIMFMNVPCICTSYNIDNDEEAGYDPITLLPRRIKISLSLREVRLRGSSFAPSEGTSRNMPGWDSLYDEDKENSQGYPTMDPFDQVGGIIKL